MQYWQRIAYEFGLVIALSVTMLWPAPAAATNHSPVITEAYLETQRATISLLEQIIGLQQRAIDTQNYGLLPQIDQLQQSVQALQNVLVKRAAANGQSLDITAGPAEGNGPSSTVGESNTSNSGVSIASSDEDPDEYRSYTNAELEEIIEEELNTLDPDFPREEFMVCGASDGVSFASAKTLPIPGGTVTLENGTFNCIDGLWTPKITSFGGEGENITMIFGSETESEKCRAFDGTDYPAGIETLVRYNTINFEFRAECVNSDFDVTIMNDQN